MPVLKKEQKSLPIPRRRLFLLSLLVLSFFAVSATLLFFVDRTIEFVSVDTNTGSLAVLLPFPVGVDPEEKLISELPQVEQYLTDELVRTTTPNSPVQTGFLRKAVAKLALLDWYQNLAAGSSRVLVIQPGERKEQIAMNFAKILKWSDGEKLEFIASVISSNPILLEGKFAPGSYIVVHGATPGEVALLISQRFNDTVVARYGSDITDKVPLQDALTIASLIEREAYDFNDMRYIAGVIWNRLFIDMNLQIDATLQYAKGEAAVKTWWPRVIPDDKYIESPFNTYRHKGLPPTPIASPSVDAILAALNPRQTDCMYYFHDKDSGFHCSKTYQDHVKSLKEYYGRGK